MLRRLTSLYERLELYGPALDAAQASARLFSAFDTRQENASARTSSRLAARVAALEREEQRLAAAISQSGDERADSRRLWTRRLKRIRQKLGRESSIIRLGR